MFFYVTYKNNVWYDFKNKISLIIIDDKDIDNITYYLSLLNKKGSLLIIGNKDLFGKLQNKIAELEKEIQNLKMNK